MGRNTHAQHVLVADVGGTHTRLAIASSNDDGIVLGEATVLASDAIHDFASAVIDFCRDSATNIEVSAVAVAVAGPVAADQRRMHLTNLDLRIDADAIADRLHRPVQLVNDFSAQAAAVPALKAGQIRWHQEPAKVTAPCAVLGPGTGLGVSAWLGDNRVLHGEGGHVQLSPADDRERRVFPRLADDTGFVAAEDMLCGSGLERLYQGLRALDGQPTDGVDAAEVASRAEAGDTLAGEAIHRFTAALGRVSGDLALTVGARCLMIGGGIIPHWGRAFDATTFRRAFEDKGRYRAYMERTPSATMAHPQPGLLGLAQLALGRESGGES